MSFDRPIWSIPITMGEAVSSVKSNRRLPILFDDYFELSNKLLNLSSVRGECYTVSNVRINVPNVLRQIHFALDEVRNQEAHTDGGYFECSGFCGSTG